MSDDPRDTPLEGLLDTFGEALRRGMFTSEPGKITRYDEATRRASVQLSIPRRHVDQNDQVVVQLPPELTSVPVVFLGPARGAITWPVAPGDDCLVWFASSSTKAWRGTGRAGVNPGEDATHDINSPFCMVCDFFSKFTAPADKVVINGPNRLGGPTGTEPTFMANSFMSAFNTLIAAIATAVGGAGGVAITSAKTAFDTAASGFKTTDTEVK